MVKWTEVLEIEITEETEDYGVEFASGTHNGLDYCSGVSIERRSVKQWARSREWDAVQVAIDAELCEDTDDIDMLPDDVFVWFVDNDVESHYYTDFNEAKDFFVETVEINYDGECELDEILASKGSNRHAWMYEGVSDEDRAATTEDMFTDMLVTHVSHQPDKDISVKMAKLIASEFKQRYPTSFERMFKEYTGS